METIKLLKKETEFATQKIHQKMTAANAHQLSDEHKKSARNLSRDFISVMFLNEN
jgi:hypothetical protein